MTESIVWFYAVYVMCALALLRAKVQWLFKKYPDEYRRFK